MWFLRMIVSYVASAPTALFLCCIVSVILPSVLWHCWLGVRKNIWPVKIMWWGAGMVIYLEWGANDLHMLQLMPLPPHHLCFVRIQIGTFLVLAYPGCCGKEAIKQASVSGVNVNSCWKTSYNCRAEVSLVHQWFCCILLIFWKSDVP